MTTLMAVQAAVVFFAGWLFADLVLRIVSNQ